MIYLLCTTLPLLQRFVCVGGGGLLRHRGGNPELFTSLFLLPEFLFILLFSLVLQGECVAARSCFLCQRRVRFSSSLLLLFSLSQAARLRTHHVKGKSNDRSSLERERPRNHLSLLRSVLSSSVLCPPPALACLTSPRRATPSSAFFVSLSVSPPPQIPTPWGSTALTMP